MRVPRHVQADERPDDDGKDRGCHPIEMMTSMITTPPPRARVRVRARARARSIIIISPAAPVRIVPPAPIGVGTARPQDPARAVARQRRLQSQRVPEKGGGDLTAEYRIRRAIHHEDHLGIPRRERR